MESKAAASCPDLEGASAWDRTVIASDHGRGSTLQTGPGVGSPWVLIGKR